MALFQRSTSTRPRPSWPGGVRSRLFRLENQVFGAWLRLRPSLRTNLLSTTHMALCVACAAALLGAGMLAAAGIWWGIRALSDGDLVWVTLAALGWMAAAYAWSLGEKATRAVTRALRPVFLVDAPLHWNSRWGVDALHVWPEGACLLEIQWTVRLADPGRRAAAESARLNDRVAAASTATSRGARRRF